MAAISFEKIPNPLTEYGRMAAFGGYNIVVHRPVERTVQRSWRERLTARPWRPWVATRTEWIEPAVHEDEVLVTGNTMHVGQEAYDRIRKAMLNDQPLR